MDDELMDDEFLNCANGTLNIRTGEFREYGPDNQPVEGAPQTLVTYDPKATAPTWLAFLQTIRAEEVR